MKKPVWKLTRQGWWELDLGGGIEIRIYPVQSAGGWQWWLTFAPFFEGHPLQAHGIAAAQEEAKILVSTMIARIRSRLDPT